MFIRYARSLFLLVFSVAFYVGKAQPSPTLIPILGNCNSTPGFSLIVPNYTNTTPYFIFWGVPPGCPTPTLNSIPSGGTYTTLLSAPCNTAYNVVILDANSNFIAGSNSTGPPGNSAGVNFIVTSSVAPLCNGNCNGSRNLLWSGTGPLTLTFFPVSSSSVVLSNVPTGVVQTYTNLCAGTHSFIATDANGCTFTTGLTFTLGEPAPLGANVFTSNPTCNGFNNGVFSVTPTGGTAGYTVVLSNGSTVTLGAGQSATVGGISSGSVSAVIRDSRNCTYTVVANYTQPSLITFASSQTNIACGGNCTGIASVTVNGGGGGYTYTWSPGPGSTPTISGLCAQTHTLFVTDANGCLRNHAVTITQPTSITITPTITNVVCHGNCTGAVSVTASGPSGPFTYTWLAPPSGNAVSNATAITNQCAGPYTLMVATSATCFNTFPITIGQPSSAISASAATTSVNCIGLCNGSATAMVSGGNGAPFTYTWTAATPPPAPQNGATATALCAGVYTMSTRDAFGCPASYVFNIVQPAAFGFGITTTTVTCNGLCNGILNVSPSGGTAPYNYTLVSATGSTASASPIFNNLCAGTYTVRVRDNTPACAQQTVVTIAQPNPLLPSVIVTSLSCANVCNGQLAGSANGGVPGYTLFWATPSGTVAGGNLTNRCAGVYTFNIRDANGCNATPTTYTLNAPSAMTVNVTSTSVTCNGLCNGALSASVSGGSPGYTLTWSTGGSSNPLTNLCTGNYTLNVTDVNSCTTAVTASVSAPAAIVLTQTVAQTRCAGTCDGSATIAATGGMGTYTFQFSTVPTTSNTTGLITNLCAGNYVATVRDVNNCTVTANFSITSPLLLSAAITGTRNSCTVCTGAASVTASNGTPPYVSYAWTNSLNVSAGTGTSVSGLCPGNYTVLVTDSRSCTAVASTSIGQVIIITVVNGGTGIQCFGACTASAVANPSGGLPPYSYLWGPGAQTSATATGLCAGIHQVTVFDSNSPACSNTAAITVNQPADMVITTSTTNVTCFNSCNGAISLTVTGGTGTKSFLWSPGGMTTSSVSNLCAGVYTVLVTDANGCTKPPLTFTLSPPNGSITAAISSTNPLNCNTPNTGTISVVAGGGNGTFSYLWSPGGSTASSITSVPAGTYSLFITSGSCTQTFVTTLTNPAGPTLTQLNLQNVSCFGGNNGAATYSAGGVGPFSFTWTPVLTPTTGATTSSVAGLNSGTYVVSATDAGNNCVTTQTFFITQPASVTVSGTVTNIQCNGSSACNGSVVVSSSGGVAPYSYTWSPGSVNGASLTNQCAGIKTVQVTDNNQCASTFTFNVTTPSSITISSTVTNVKCNAACNGSVVANATGGTGAITYSWLPLSGFTGSSTATILNLCPAIYTLLAIDANNCAFSHTVSVTEPAALTSTLAFDGINCSSDCDGTATLTAEGGTPTYSFSWSSGGVTTSTIDNLCAGNYVATVTDANGCVSSQPFSISSPAVFSLNLVPTHPLCNSACNGSIETTATGAQGAVVYNWLPAGSGEDPTGLCPALYLVNAVDAQGCQALAIVTLTNPPALLANVTTTGSTCSGVCTGIAVSNPVNAQGAVSYTWSPSGPNSATNSALCAGDYSLSIQDGNGCSFSQTFTVTEPPLLTVNVSAAPASCGANNGSISAAPVGGTPNYTFAWTSPVPPPIVTTGSVVNNLVAGIYTVVITDANSCTNTITIPLSNSNGPLAPITSTNVICNGNCTGAASVGVISAGTAPYQVPVWIIPTPTVQADALFNLCAGDYSVQLVDNNNCITFTGTTISEPPPISILPNSTLPLCAGVCNGTVTLNTSGGVAPYTYTWIPGTSNSSVLTNACAGDYSVLVGYNNGSCTSQQVITVAPQTSISIAPPVTTANTCFGDCSGSATINVLSTSGGSASLSWSDGQTGSSATLLCSAIYSVTVSDAQGCRNTFSVPITSPPQLTLTSSVTQPDCGQCNGSATVSAGGGSGTTYSFNWTNGGSTNMASNLCAGLYQVLITDSANCSQTADLTLNSSSGITGDTATKNNESCFGLCDGSATVTAIGGTLPVTYKWLNTPVPNVTSVGTNLCSDLYYVLMTDAVGCARTASVQIDPATQLNVSAFVLAPGCGLNDGGIDVVVSGGVAPYVYSWTPTAANTGTLTNLPAGSYTLTITDNNGAGCASTQVFALSNSNGPSFQATQIDATCFNSCDGSITLTSSVSPSPTYSWSTGATSNSVSLLCEGLVTVTVTSAGCSVVRNFTVNSRPQLLIDLNLQNVQCNGECNGAVAVLPNGGSLPYVFSWVPAQSTMTNSIDSLCAGNYSVAVTDANGCPASATPTISEAPQIVITSTLQNSTCTSIADGNILVNVLGGSPTFTYTWQGPGTFTSTQQNLSNLLAGTYSLTLLDAANCTQDTSFSIVPTVTLVAEAGQNFSVCPGSSVTVDGSTSQGAASFLWMELPLNNTLTATPGLNIAEALNTQTFVLQVAALNNTCFDTDTVEMFVYSQPYVDAGPSYTIPVFSSVTIGGNPTTDGIITHTWSPAIYLNDEFAQNPVASNTAQVIYTVSIMYGSGCLVSDTMVVDLYPEIKITSAFSPNGDGKNDSWIIDYIDQFPANTVEIYNRWGELLFHSQGYKDPFDGTYHGERLPVGTYYYIIQLNHQSYTKPYTGPLTIFR